MTDLDRQFLRQALKLAAKGHALASPNPMVGAVVVDQNDNLAGEGFHTYDGVKHAEIVALDSAAERARGGTLYVTLEPCSHHGRTGPCSDAIVAAGIRRVVAPLEDGNPEVRGRGFERLRAAGIEVEVANEFRREAYRMYEEFRALIASERDRWTRVIKQAGITGS